MTDEKRDLLPTSDDPIRALVEVMAALRSEQGCPWDREQTHSTLRPYLIEEAYEVLEAIDDGDPDELRKELGDLLLQVVFHAQLGSEAGTFTIDDVARAITEKMIRRHPHVFGETSVSGSAEVLTNWEQIKLQEQAGAKQKPSLFRGVPGSLPALLQAMRLQEKAATVGFDWPSDEGVLDKLAEEIDELRAAHHNGDAINLEEEFGDVFFLLANLARHWNVDPEAAARMGCQKFIRRFTLMEELAAADGTQLKGMTLDEMDAYWDRAKAHERNAT